MPHSRFLVQNERFALEELVASSVLPCFVSDITLETDGPPPGRTVVPILDSEAKVTYYMVCLKNTFPKVKKLFNSYVENL